MMNLHTNRGITLIELLIAITISAILTIAAAPGMTGVIKSNRMSSAANDFLAAMQFAKNQSIAQLTPVTLCKKNLAGDNCTTAGGWEQGWIVFSDSDRNALVDSASDILLHHEALNASITFRGTSNIANALTYTPINNTSLVSLATMTLCDDRGFTSGRGIIVSITGNGSLIETNQTGLSSCL
jgi:type IV fimbrial biogenesis protein FimT